MTILSELEQRRAGWQRRAATLEREIDQLDQEPPYMDTGDLTAIKIKNLELAAREIRMLNLLITAAKQGDSTHATN